MWKTYAELISKIMCSYWYENLFYFYKEQWEKMKFVNVYVICIWAN